MLYDKKFIPSWNNMVERIHRCGAKASIKEIRALQVRGGNWSEGVFVERLRRSKALVTPLTTQDIQTIEAAFAATAKNAMLAEFDAVTIHAAHGYLIAEFLSPLYNKRTDEYGGELETDAGSFLRPLANAGRRSTSFPIMVRISGEEYIEGGEHRRRQTDRRAP